MGFDTVNPATEEVLGHYEFMERAHINEVLSAQREAQRAWADIGLSERLQFLSALGQAITNNKEKYAELITTEMGKPIKESIAEIEKCALTCQLYSEKGTEWLQEERVEADGLEHHVLFRPLGTVLSIMPWNFPFWQAVRFAVPALAVGNGVLLKPSSVVPECAFALQEAFQWAGIPDHVFRILMTDHETTDELIAHDDIHAISLTGSTTSGSIVAAAAGKAIKKCVLELGGSDSFVVCSDADIEKAAAGAVTSRFLNCGQSCIAAKRIIVVKSVFENFVEAFKTEVEKKQVGDPMEEGTDMGPLVTRKAREEIEKQVTSAVKKGARAVTGGKTIKGKGFYFEPTILTQVVPEMNVFKEEVFGPVAPVFKAENEEEALTLANQSQFGLGASIWTKDVEKGKTLARKFECGTVFVNSMVKSDPRMPFGGVKKSGLGRELSKYGLREFMNVQGLNVYSG